MDTLWIGLCGAMVLLALFARAGVKSFDAVGRMALPEPWLTLFTWPFTPEQAYRRGVSGFIFAQQIATLFALVYVLYPGRSLRVFWALVLAGYVLGGCLAWLLYKRYPAAAPPRFIYRFQLGEAASPAHVKPALGRVLGVSEDRVALNSFEDPIEAWDFLTYPVQLLKDDDKPVYGVRLDTELIKLHRHRARVMQGLSDALDQTLYTPIIGYHLMPGVGVFMHQPGVPPQAVYLGVEDIHDVNPVEIDSVVALEAVYSVGHTITFLSGFGSMAVFFPIGFLLLRTSELWAGITFLLAFPSMFALGTMMLSTWYRWAIDRGTDPRQLQQRMVGSLTTNANPKRWARALDRSSLLDPILRGVFEKLYQFNTQRYTKRLKEPIEAYFRSL